MRSKKLYLGLALVTAALASAILFACSQTPTTVAVRTFERAQRVDMVCLQLYDNDRNYNPIVPEPRPLDECAPVPDDVDGESYVKQLFAVVTQTARGELAVVDVSARKLVDQTRAVPGVNFIPVGSAPTDVATTPDSQMVFVATAEVNKPAIYGIPSRRLLGDTPGFPAPEGTPALTSWPVCALPQRPGALAIVPRRGPAFAGDAGAVTDAGIADAGSDAGATATPAEGPDYELVAVLPGDRLNSAKVVTIDPRPFLRGAAPPGQDAGLGDGPSLAPGVLQECPITSAIELVGGDSLPPTFTPGQDWGTGLAYFDGGIDLTCSRPLGAACGSPFCCPAPQLPPPPPSDAGDGGDGGDGGNDAGAPELFGEVDASACVPVEPVDAGPIALDVGPLDPPKPLSVARRDNILYIADGNVPFVHVLDLTVGGAPREVSPLIATNLVDPARASKISSVAVSPATRDYKRFLYAVDSTDGSVLVYDVTDPFAADRTPLKRPNPELNPFQGLDRIIFPSPVVDVTFARHDFPLTVIGSVPQPNAPSGLLCNPNDAGTDLGVNYRANGQDFGPDLGPNRLRGVFAFAAMSNGQVAIVDVDDWDAPCRRPVVVDETSRDPSGDAGTSGAVFAGTVNLLPPLPYGSLVKTQPDGTGPYQAPTVDPDSVTKEAVYPVIAPHRLRSLYPVSNESTAGTHSVNFERTPTASLDNVPLPLTGAGSENSPQVGVLLARDVPDSNVARQKWDVTYEGKLPNTAGFSATLKTDDGYQSLVLDQGDAHFCARGIEDWDLGQGRARQFRSAGLVDDPLLEYHIADYVQFNEDLLDASDPYWGVPQACWAPEFATAGARYDVCQKTFGAAEDENPSRDFPILQAFDGKLVVGGYFVEADGVRRVAPKQPYNAALLSLAQCCFHGQAKFNVRSGGVWSVVGKNPDDTVGLGLLNNIEVGADARCVASCDVNRSLLNSRLPTLPSSFTGFIDRDSPLVSRNPIFTVAIRRPQAVDPRRNMLVTFSTNGEYVPFTVGLGSTSSSVSPQSIRYIETLGQIAVVDGASQGLVFIELDNLTIASGSPFY